MIKPADTSVQERDLVSSLPIKVCAGVLVWIYMPMYQSLLGKTEFEDIKVFYYINIISH